MKRFRTSLTVSLAAMALVALAGCNDYGNTFQSNTGAILSSLSPSNIPAGGGDLTITVDGAGFVTKTVVEWNGQKLVTTPNTLAPPDLRPCWHVLYRFYEQLLESVSSTYLL